LSLAGDPVALAGISLAGKATLRVLAGREGAKLVACVEGLLDLGEQEALRAATLGDEARFVDASIGGAREDWRIGQVVYDPPEPALLVAQRVREMAIEVAAALDVKLDTIAEVERQLTAYGDGCFYKRHTDSRGPEAKRRALSWVHYFACVSPPAFTGGELRVWDDDEPYDHDPYVIAPADGLTVFFGSSLDHEVARVNVASKRFADSRFTVNGWIWRP